ncbi:MAG TPA: hypothetical protein VFS33_04665 [Gemmatimonadales bacterium]|nr:hypothetical protein [Gemmatimonadales bacterium]
MDLREQLQSSLGSGIALDRELGGGSMSRVLAGMLAVESSPAYASLRPDPRFAEFVRRVHEAERR